MRSEWRDIEDFPDWIVSDGGLVMNSWTSKIVAIRQNNRGLSMVNLVKDGIIHTRLVGPLVANAFLEPPRWAHFNTLIYLNGDKEDCRANNLMWRPRGYALKYHRMFDREPIRVAVYIPELDRSYGSLREFCTTWGLVERSCYSDMLNHDKCFVYNWTIERI